MSKLVSVLGATALILGACAAVPLQAPASSEGDAVRSVEVSASRCFGACPAYRFTFTPAGHVVFDGRSDTAVAGETTSQVDAGQARRAVAALEPWRRRARTGFVFVCDDRITDQPAYTVRWTEADGAVSELRHDRGCLSSEGRAFAQVIDGLPSRLGLVDQIGAPGR